MPRPILEIDEVEFTRRFIDTLGEFAPERPDLLARHAWLVAKKNEVMNLTRIVEPEDMANRHALDSLAALPIVMGTDDAPVHRVLDLGTGAGYPGLALAIAAPQLQVTLLDATRKKIDFLTEVVADLGLDDRVDCVWGRFEEWIKPRRKDYDIVMARAVGPLSRLLEWTRGNWFGPMLLWKGPGFDDEMDDAFKTLGKRKMDVVLDLPYQVPDDEAFRRLAMIDWV